MPDLIPTPEASEYQPYQHAYVSLVPAGGRLLETLREGADATEALLRSYPASRLTTPHAPGEWTVQDVLQHITDQEHIFAYRALCLARGDKTPLPGFEQDDYAAVAGANARGLDDLLAEYRAVRTATIALIGGLREDTLSSVGTVSAQPMSVRAAIYIIAGHELYHLDSIRTNYG